MTKKPEKQFTVESEPITWPDLEGKLHSGLQFFVSVDGDQRYVFEPQEDGIETEAEAIALAMKLEG